MDDEIRFKKGACGYSAPGPTGLPGAAGASVHFSSYDSMTDDDVIEKICAGKSLSYNPNCDEDEEYHPGDCILTYSGKLFMINTINPNTNRVKTTQYGNIIFRPENEYHAPYNTHFEECALLFENDTAAETSGEVGGRFAVFSQEDYIKHTDSDTSIGSTSPLWHHRFHRNCNVPGIKLVPNNTVKTLEVYDDETHETEEGKSSKEFIEDLINSDGFEFAKIVLLFQSSIAYEKVLHPGMDPSEIYIPFLFGYVPFGDGTGDRKTLAEELNPNATLVNLYKSYIGTTSPKPSDDYEQNSICRMYFEYTHKGKTYRMRIYVNIN